MTVTVHSVPATPVITLLSDHLVSSVTSGNQWYGSNGSIEGATGQNFYPTYTDNYFVLVSNQYGCESDQSNTIYFIYTSIGEQHDKSVKIYPNPVKDHLVVEYKLSDETKVSIRLYDKLGQLVTVLLPEVRQGADFYHLEFSLPEVGSGIFMINVESDLFIVTRKLIISR